MDGAFDRLPAIAAAWLDHWFVPWICAGRVKVREELVREENAVPKPACGTATSRTPGWETDGHEELRIARSEAGVNRNSCSTSRKASMKPCATGAVRALPYPRS